VLKGNHRIVGNTLTNKTMNDFYEKVYEVVRLIPPGRVTSYGAIAAFLGSTQSSRMVGWAMNNAHFQEKYVPAHRVVNRNGLLTGKHHFGTSTAMQEFLEAEGVKVIDDQIIDFEKHFWNPASELEIE
jgi:methylated-DNA-protein-cysteine methyltransferase-like protein